MPSKWPIDTTFKEISIEVTEIPFRQCARSLAIVLAGYVRTKPHWLRKTSELAITMWIMAN